MPAEDMPRYRLDFIVADEHDIQERGAEDRNPTLDRLRAALAADPRWDRSMLRRGGLSKSSSI